jgi:demethylmenaquinone methyltransferase/2-methoxy-6-polyprenyl-1,4-benzoquinol methylase
VLYPGIGRGEDAIQAARLGVAVTAVDVSQPMLRRFRRKLDRERLEAELIRADVSIHRPREPYDVVVANYFLNLFDADRARAMLALFGGWLRPGGLLLISDFARPTGGPLARLLSEVYYRPINWTAWALGLCALHPILDYRRLLSPSTFRIVAEDRLPVLWGQNPAYTSIVAERLRS